MSGNIRRVFYYLSSRKRLLTLLEDSVVLGNEKGLLSIIGLVGFVLGGNLLVDVGTELLVKHFL